MPRRSISLFWKISTLHSSSDLGLDWGSKALIIMALATVSVPMLILFRQSNPRTTTWKSTCGEAMLSWIWLQNYPNLKNLKMCIKFWSPGSLWKYVLNGCCSCHLPSEQSDKSIPVSQKITFINFNVYIILMQLQYIVMFIFYLPLPLLC